MAKKAVRQPTNPVLQSIDENKSRLQDNFRAFGDSVDAVRNAEQLLRASANTLELSMDNFESLLESFINLVHATHAEDQSISFEEFLSLLRAWTVSNHVQPLKLKQVQELFLQQLDKSIKQYTTLSRQTRDQEELNSIHELLQILKNKKNAVLKASKPSRVNFTFRKVPTQQEEKGIEDIFKFYTKQHVMTGKAPTFDYIGEIVEVIDSGSFVFFCKSFGLVSDKKVEGKRFLSKGEAVNIFKKCSTLQKKMNFDGFKAAIDELALAYFSEEYDKIASIPCSHIGLDEKRVMLYELIRCGDPRFLHHALKPIGGAFFNSVDRASRIQSEDPKKQYKFRVTEEVKEQLKNFKKEKELKMKQEREVNTKESYEKAKVAQKKLRERREQEELKKRKDVIRIQDLDKINYKDLGEDEDLEDLIM